LTSSAPHTRSCPRLTTGCSRSGLALAPLFMRRAS
jgi:hypothetical protein